jgi:hypothetical protein
MFKDFLFSAHYNFVLHCAFRSSCEKEYSCLKLKNARLTENCAQNILKILPYCNK